MKKISFDCPECAHFQTLSFSGEQKTIDFKCGHCQHALTLQGLEVPILDTCPVCQTEKLYQHKDFNKTIGFLVFIVGAILIPWTYAISLIVALAIDALLYPFFPWMQVCYFCKSELRGFAHNPKLDRFNHETAAHFEYGQKKWVKPQSEV